MNYPGNLRYNREHLWVKVEGNFAYIGITDYAQDQLGDILFVDLPDIGAKFKKGEQFSEVESAKVNSALCMPFTGTVKEVNAALDEEPEQINQSPYESWIAKFELDDPAELCDLISASEYEAGLE